MKRARVPLALDVPARPTPGGRLAARAMLWAATICAAVVSTFPHPARANPADVFGFGSEAIARGGAMTAVATDFSATFYNPAGLAFGAAPTITFGTQGVLSRLTAATPTASLHRGIEEPWSLLVGGTLPVSRTFALGFGASLLPSTFIRVLTHPADDPTFAYFDNRTQRILLLPGAAFRPFPWLSFGLAANLLAGLDGALTAAPGATNALEAATVQEFDPRVSLHAGLRVQPTESLSFGLTYRQAFDAPFREHVVTRLSGLPITLDVRQAALPTPHELSLGAALHLAPLTLSLDATWLHFAAVASAVPVVDARVSSIAITLPHTTHPFRDTVDVRVGAALENVVSPRVTLVYRAGAGFQPSMVAAQPGVSSLLDAPKLTLSAGLGVVLSHVGRHRLRIDVHAQAIGLVARRFDKRAGETSDADPARFVPDESPDPGFQTANVGYPFVTARGAVFTFGATLTLEVAP